MEIFESKGRGVFLHSPILKNIYKPTPPMTKTKIPKLSANMKEVVKEMRNGKQLLRADSNGSWFFEAFSIPKKTADALHDRGIIECYEYILTGLGYFTLTDLGKTIEL